MPGYGYNSLPNHFQPLGRICPPFDLCTNTNTTCSTLMTGFPATVRSLSTLTQKSFYELASGDRPWLGKSGQNFLDLGREKNNGNRCANGRGVSSLEDMR